MAELGTGYISIIPDASKITPGIKKALGDASGELARAGESGGKSFGGKFTSAATGLLKKGGIAAGAAGGAAVAAGITKGLGRLNSIEQAEAKLKGLGNSTAQVGSIMENALASVNGTAFGLEEAATTAGSLVAAGIKPGQELEGVLTTVADTATIAGRSMSDMGLIFGSVAAKGKLQGDDMLQLLAGGIPVLQLLADETGKTSAEISDMVSNGEVDFALFERAMKRGMGGAALEAGNTVQGAFKNMGAAAGRLGATIAGPFFTQAAGGFSGVTKALDEMNERAKPVMEEFAGWMTGEGIPAVKEFAASAVESFRSLAASDGVQSALEGTSLAFDQLVSAGRALAPALGQIGVSLAQASAAVGIGTWQLFNAALTTAGSVAQSLAGPLQTVADLMQDHPGMVTAAVAAWAGFKTIPALLGKAASGIAGITGAAKSMKGTEKPAEAMALAFAPITSRAKSAAASVQSFGTSMKVQKGIAADMGVKLSTVDAAMGAMGGTSSKAAQGMSSAYAKASSSLKVFAMQQQLASAAAQNMAQSGKGVMTSADAIARSMGHSATAAVSNFAGTIKGTGAAAMSGFKSAGKGVIDMLGGPWGAAMAGAGAAMMLYSDAQNRATQFTEAGEKIAALSTDTYKEMFEVMASGGDAVDVMAGKISTLTDSLETQGKSNDGFLAGVQRWGTGLAAALNPGNWGAAIEQLNFDNAADSAEAAADAIDSLGLSDRQLAEAVNGSQAGYDAMRQKLVEMGDGGKAAALHLDSLREASLNAQQKLDEMGPAASTASEAMKEIADSSDDASAKVGKVRRALMELNGVELSATEAQAALTEAISSAAGGMDQFAGATVKANGNIDTTTDSGVALFNSMMELGDAMSTAVASGNDVNQVFHQSSGQLEAMRQSAGLSEQEWNKLLETMRMTPEGLSIDAKIANGDAVLGELEVIRGQVNDLQGGGPYEATISVNDAETKQKLEQAGWDLSNYDEKTGTATLSLEDDGAKALYNWWMNTGFMDIDMSNPTAVANLDDTGLRVTAGFAQLQLETLDLARPTPLANMDTSQLDAKAIEVFNQVGLLDGMNPTPDANLDISQLNVMQQKALALVFDLSAKSPTPVASLDTSGLDNGAGASKEKVDDLDKSKANPKVDLDPKPVQDGARQAQDAINNIQGRNITVTFTAAYGGDWDKADRNSTGRWTGGLWNGPAYASGGQHAGYRLPKTGPGTGERDGFMAFDRNNVPAARLDAGEWIINRRNSEKYDRELAQINAGTFPKLPGYADGGRHGAVKHADEIIEFAKGIDGKPYVRGGVNWGDCSGAMSAIARFAVGLEPFAGRFATASERSALLDMGFTLGKGSRGDLRFGWHNKYGDGHTSGTLPNEVNVEMGGSGGGGRYSGGAVGAWDSDYDEFAYIQVPTHYQSNLTGMPDTAGFTVGGDGDTSIPSGRGASSAKDKEKTPTSWSEVAGIAGKSFASGMVGDLLQVLGIPDTPPALAAYAQLQDAAGEEGESDVAKTADDLAAAKKSLDLAEEDLRIAKMKKDEVDSNEKSTESQRASADQRVAKAQKKVDDLNAKISTLESESGVSGFTVDTSEDEDGPSASVSYDPSKGAEQWRPVVLDALKRVGGSQTDADRTVTQIGYESGGNPQALGPDSSEGKPTGLLQTKPGTFEAFRDKSLGGITDPLANIVAALNYVAKQYGGPSNVWPTRAGYATGGQVNGPGGRRADRIPAWLSDMEHVVNAGDAIANRDLLGAINAGFPGQQVMEGLWAANRELSIASEVGDAGYSYLTALMNEGRARLNSSMASEAGLASRSDGGQTVVNNQFIAANPEEMHRLYRREAGKRSRGKVGAR